MANAVLAGALLSGLVGVTVIAQSRAGAEFDAASVRVATNRPDSPRNSVVYGPNGVTYGGVALGFIIGDAYAFPVGRIGGPGSRTPQALWTALSTGYDIVARSDRPVARTALRAMLQSLLADRFHLVLHRESVTQPVYELRVLQGGPRLGEAAESGQFMMQRTPSGYMFENSDLVRLASFLSGQVDRAVTDGTGLPGLYTFTLVAAETGVPGDSGNKREGSSPDTPSSAAYGEGLRRLGLQLIAARAPVEYLVVDRVDALVEN